ncbi:aryl-sulfate sulfotransferase [Pseudomonas koreensis]|uniref:Aryl-sulfate sulfotransferase n=2 Tax=Pseudomonas TaxID=286 RepID=A0A4Q4L9S2_9PSED|nr:MULTISPECIES: ribbon-helix-helix domain-containing protein [Pseudomonas]WKV83119.1 ribbon-helix-helix domain-containing protein [Pseudomonas sp. B24_DOA]WKV88689.1 ribbon-helix-helix domain-containing protein [Pseudomonas sp. B21_DOA]KIF63815.1 arylsulfate sulfotransferase [Pseudomonas fluorescens]MDM8190355.1 ribbon-helix-helix domain-containing protein [Pseudomonas fluorescens]MDP8571600.1 ribbon-helix-helix domain-containing protein [Pseudomonas iranensis]
MVEGDRRSDRMSASRHVIKVDPFVSEFDMNLIRPLSRSIRLNGFATCLRLEQVYWNILGGMAEANHCSISTLLSHVDREVHLRHGGVKNFSALVRVVCVMNGIKELAPAVSR